MQCTNTNNPRHLIEIDIRDPATAMKSAKSKRWDPPTRLFRATNPLGTNDVVQVGTWQASLSRRLLLRSVTVAHNLCPHNGVDDNGVWYTDPKGYIAHTRPGPNNMRQYVKPGFSLVVADTNIERYEVSDTWNGLYKKGIKGRFNNIANGVDYLTN
jgi:hypothetical protein